MWGGTWGRFHRLQSVWGVVITTDLTNLKKIEKKILKQAKMGIF